MFQFGREVSRFAGICNSAVAVNLIMGLACQIYLSQALLVLGVPGSVAQFVTISILLGVLLCRRRFSRALPESKFPVSKLNADLRFAIAIALLVVAARHWWLLPFALPVAFLERLSQGSRLTGMIAVLTGIATCCGAFVAVAIRPDRWWHFYQGNDLQFFESISWAITQWGVFEHPGRVGGSFFRYHWFTYAMFGEFSHSTFLKPWESLSIFGVLLLPGLAASLLNSGQATKVSYLRWLLVLAATFWFSLTTADSLRFSLIVAMAFLAFAIQCERHKVEGTLGSLLGSLLLSLSLSMSKTSTAVVVLAILLIRHFIRVRAGQQTSLVPTATLGMSMLSLYAGIFQDTASQTRLSALVQFRSHFDSSNLKGFLGLLLSPQISTQLAICALVLMHLRRTSIGIRLDFAQAAVVVALLFGYLSRAFPPSEALYFGTVGFSLLVFLLIQNHLEGSGNSAGHGLGLFVIALTWFVVQSISQFLPRGGLELPWPNQEVWLPLLKIPSDLSQNLIFGLILPIIGLVVMLRANHAARLLVLLSLLIAYSAYGGFTSYRQSSHFGADALTNWRGGNSAPFADSDLRIVANYIRNDRPQDEILASNNFCCHGSEWWSRIVDNLDIYDFQNGNSLLNLEPSLGGANYLLPAETRRRFLIQGLAFQVQTDCDCYGRPTSDQIRRMTLSLQFANSPTMEVVEDLRGYGVSGYVVNLTLTDHRDWSEFAIEKFKSGNFVFLELSKRPAN